MCVGCIIHGHVTADREHLAPGFFSHLMSPLSLLLFLLHEISPVAATRIRQTQVHVRFSLGTAEICCILPRPIGESSSAPLRESAMYTAQRSTLKWEVLKSEGEKRAGVSACKYEGFFGGEG